MVTPEEEVDKYRYKEDGKNKLPVLPSGSCGITVEEDEIATLRCDGITVNDNNEPSYENFIRSDDVLPIPSSLNFSFHFINTWNQSGNFPVMSSKLKTTLIPMIQYMFRLDFFMNL